MTLSHPPALAVRDLCVTFQRNGCETRVIHDIDFEIAAGETLALVGESGSGKSVTSMALMRLLGRQSRAAVTGQVALHAATEREPIDLLQIDDARMRQLRGRRIAMIFQEPLTALNPVHRVGDQIAEVVRFHSGSPRRQARAQALALLEQVGIPEPSSRLDSYPHELSGGMRQRVVIAMALAMEPDVLIADEPTTALDVTVQAQILTLLKTLQRDTGMAMLFITHDFGVVSEVADRVAVMYAGRIVEEGDVEAVLARPLMPYTAGLLASVPRLERAGLPGERLATIAGRVPDPASLPAGCSFQPRCTFAVPGTCDSAVPALASLKAGRRVRCTRAHELIPAEELSPCPQTS
ncbi:ABC transporter ATP-binding protein [Salinicola aestuarinus]|uniref:ABC transporter ATP-binding protein n=1 Tax=Salinicola aestuarinus TaxID=1949082 RepID=UPI000DA10D8A|nr:ABC transporter ATP-binding protein [Salinicola aestuarinus]